MRLLAVIFLMGLFFTPVSDAGPGNGTLVKRTIQQQISSRVANSGKVAVMCLATTCALQFLPSATAADLDGLDTRSELLSKRGRSGIFSKPQGETEKGDNFKGSWWIGKGVMEENDDISSIFAFGLEGETPKFGLYLHSNFHNPHSDGIDKIGIDAETRAGANLVLLGSHQVEGDEVSLSVGYHNIDVLVKENQLKINSLRNYLLLFREGKSVKMAIWGLEYIDGHADKVTGSDDLRAFFTSFFRLGLGNFSINIKDGVDVGLGIKTVLGAGRFWQQELLDWSGRSYLDGAFAKIAANLDLILANGAITLGFGGEHTRAGRGEYFVGESVVSTSLGIDLVPKYGIELEGYLQLYHQRLEDDGTHRAGDEELFDTNKGHRAVVFLVKEFD